MRIIFDAAFEPITAKIALNLNMFVGGAIQVEKRGTVLFREMSLKMWSSEMLWSFLL